MINLSNLQQQMREKFARDLRVDGYQDDAYPDWALVSQVLLQILHSLDGPARVVGISGPQGSGKSTLAGVLRDVLCAAGIQADCVSLDDFYLSQSRRGLLAETVHPLLATRGVPGTHDHRHLAGVLGDFRRGVPDLTVPVFDKARDNPVGERRINARVLILEGWCLGVRAQPATELSAPVNHLEAEEDSQGVWRRWVNRQIRLHYEGLWSGIDVWAYLRIPGFRQVYQWRAQQEQQIEPALRMSEVQLQRFIAHYERLTRWLWGQVPLQPGVLAELDEDHHLMGVNLLAKP